jgi:hypothetical protein
MSKVNLFFIRGLFLVVCWFCSNTINAYDFEVDGLYYGINRVDKTAVFVTEGNNKYQGDITIPQSVVFEGKEYKVKSIDNVAFYQCYSLNSIKLPDGLQSISQFAFYQCSALSRIEIPNSVNSIGLSAFEGCGNLSYVKLPISISTINDMVFYKCSKLSSIIIPEGVTSIGSGAFYACSSLSSVSIPTSVVNIGDGAFNSCRELTNIEFPPNLESIGASAFLNCSKIETLTIPANLKFIGNNAFKGCSILTLVKSYIETPFTIDDTVFKGISSFAKLEVPKGTKAKYQALSGWITCFKEIVEMDGATATASGLCGDNVTWNYYDSDNKLVIGGTGEMYDYSNGNYPWYSYRANIKTVVIEEGITHIGNGSFFSCKKLDSVTIPNSVSSIGSFAFTDCVSITALTVPNSVNSIGDYAFRNCNALTSITISKNVKTIGAANPWAGCNLSTISVDKSNPIYDSRDNCNAIIKTSTKELIAGCNSTTVPYGITSIGGSAFSGCDRLTSLVIPTSVTSIGNSAFINCSSLTSITIPNGVTSIGSQAFQSCSGLASITIPNSMTSIGGSAFSQCYNLVLVKSYIENPFNLDSYVFYQISSSAKLEVPNGTKNKYQVSGWSNYFKEIVEFGNSTTYNLSITSSGNGSVSYNSTTIRSKTSSFTVNAGSSATITFSPDNGYRIKSVKVNGSTVSVGNNQYTISSINANTTVGVEFEAIPVTTYTLSIKVSGNGSATYDGTAIREETKTFTVAEGANAIITISPDDGYKVNIAKINGNHTSNLNNNVLTFSNIKNNLTVELEFLAIPTYTLSIKSTGNGSASYNGTTIRNKTSNFTLYQGKSATISFSPDNGYRIKSVKVNNSTVTVSNNQYTVSDIRKNTTLEVEFEAIPSTTYTLSITASGNGSASYDGTTIRGKTSSFTVNEGTAVKISITPDNGYRIKSVEENNTVVTSYVSNGIYTINSLSRNTTVEVEFEEILQAFSADDVNYTVVSVDERTIHLAKGNYGIMLVVPANVSYQDAEWTVTGIDNGALANNIDLAAIIWHPEVVFTEQVSNPNLLLYVNHTQYAPSNIKNVVVNGNATSITLTDAASGNNFYCPQAFTAQKISYTHNYGMQTGIGEAMGWETIALPFDVQKVTHESKGEIVSFANWRSGDAKKPFWLMQLSASGWTMAMGIKANTPYIISMPNNQQYIAGFLLNGRVTFSAENVNVPKTENLTIANYSDRTFVPAFSSMEESNNVLALNVVNDIERVTGGSIEGSTFERNLRPVHPFEAYMTLTSSTRSIGIGEGMATGIMELISVLSDEGILRIYNLNGQLIKIEEGRSLEDAVRNLPAGIYVVNGKKVIIK